MKASLFIILALTLLVPVSSFGGHRSTESQKVVYTTKIKHAHWQTMRTSGIGDVLLGWSVDDAMKVLSKRCPATGAHNEVRRGRADSIAAKGRLGTKSYSRKVAQGVCGN